MAKESESPTPDSPNVKINPPVFFTSVAIIAGLVIFSVVAPKVAENFFDGLKNWIISDAGWFYVLTVAILISLVVFLAISRYGDIKLGKDHSEPEYSYTSWFAMLFSAGMGIGL
ncbi:MAG TPA: choline transporter, partial [Alcanivorax sp.]|nr:choline transporter [Alcanivorax sp.]